MPGSLFYSEHGIYELPACTLEWQWQAFILERSGTQDSQDSLQDRLLSVSPNPPVSLLENRDNGKEPTSHCCTGWETSSQSGAWLMMIVQR